RTLADVGVRVGLSENSARMRVDRALDKLRTGLSRRGVTSTAAALGLILTQQAVLAAPEGMADVVSDAALAGVGASAGAVAGSGVLKGFLAKGILVGLLGAAGTALVGFQSEPASKAVAPVQSPGPALPTPSPK